MWLWIPICAAIITVLVIGALKTRNWWSAPIRIRRSTILHAPSHQSRSPFKPPLAIERPPKEQGLTKTRTGRRQNVQNRSEDPSGLHFDPTHHFNPDTDNSLDLGPHPHHQPDHIQPTQPSQSPESVDRTATHSTRPNAPSHASSSHHTSSSPQNTRPTSGKRHITPTTTTRTVEDVVFDPIPHARVWTDSSPHGLVKLKKKEPTMRWVVYEEAPQEVVPRDPTPPPKKRPQVTFKASFANPMVLKISYEEDSVVVSVHWPRHDADWEAKWEKRLEILAPEMPRAEYPYQNKLYIDRPDWGYRIIVWVPESDNWKPEYKTKSGAKIEGHASPIPIPYHSHPSPESSSSPSTTSTPPIGIPPKTTPVIGPSKFPSIPSLPKTSSVSSTPDSTSAVSHKFGIPMKLPNGPLETPNTKPPQITPAIPLITPSHPVLPTPFEESTTSTESEPQIIEKKPITAAPSSGNHFRPSGPSGAVASPKWGTPSTKSPFSFSKPGSTGLTTPTPTTQISTVPSAVVVPSISPSPRAYGDTSALEENSAPLEAVLTPTLPGFKSPGAMLVAPLAPFSSVPPSPLPTKSGSEKSIGVISEVSSAGSESPAVATIKVQTLPAMLTQPILLWVPEALKVLPVEAREDLVVPGVGVSPAAWKDYVSVMDDFKKYKAQMTPDHPEAVKIEELVKDISNKIGATAASFREKLGEDGLDGALVMLQRRNLMGVYYYGLERFAFKVFSEAALNKVLESESNAIKYGERLVFMLQRHPTLERFVKYWIYSKCPMAIPIYPQRRPGQDERDYKTKEMGVKPAELDNLNEYVKRTRRTMYFYASIMNTAPPDVPNPMGIGSAWSYVARTFALPRTELSLWYLEPVINICTRRLLYAYGAQWQKMALLVLKFIEDPSSDKSTHFFESGPLAGAIRVALDSPTAHTPIQHYADHESLMELKSRNSHKMEFEDGKFITPEQLDTVYMMSDAYHDYLANHNDDIIDDILTEVQNWDNLLDRVDNGQLILKESGPPRQYKSNRGGRGGGRGGRGGGYGGRGGRY